MPTGFQIVTAESVDSVSAFADADEVIVEIVTPAGTIRLELNELNASALLGQLEAA